MKPETLFGFPIIEEPIVPHMGAYIEFGPPLLAPELLWVLGAPDPEMAAIETVLRECNQRVAYATLAGERVRPDTAYKADGTTLPLDKYHVVFVECCGQTLGRIARHGAHRIDHHRPGDPGYGKPPAEFLAASSIGQVLVLLAKIGCLDAWPGVDAPEGRRAVVVPQELVFTAAADHCLAAAYRGECPGVDPDALMRWRAESRAAFQGRTIEAVLADVEAARLALAGAHSICCAAHDCSANDDHDEWVADLRGQEIPELPEAAARYFYAYLATPHVRPGERVKVVLGGHATPEVVAAFLRGELCPELVDRYGDPARGFAGGYVP